MTGNVLEGYVDTTNNWSAFENAWPKARDPIRIADVRVDHELYPSYVTTQTAREAYTNVLADVGANFPKPDVIDLHILKDVRAGTVEYIGTRGPTYRSKGRMVPPWGPRIFPGRSITLTTCRWTPIMMACPTTGKSPTA
jgi:hypothetical protein